MKRKVRVGSPTRTFLQFRHRRLMHQSFHCKHTTCFSLSYKTLFDLLPVFSSRICLDLTQMNNKPKCRLNLSFCPHVIEILYGKLASTPESQTDAIYSTSTRAGVKPGSNLKVAQQHSCKSQSQSYHLTTQDKVINLVQC